MEGLNIQWLDTAQEDLRAIRIYYMENAGKTVTHNRIKKIMNSVSLLSKNPYLGKGEDLNNTGFLFVEIIKYIIIFVIIK